MARPPSEGLDYFPLNVDTSEDPGVAYVEAIHGLPGYAVYIKLLSLIYRGKGYYTSWGERDRIVFARSSHMSVADLDDIVSTAVEVGLFDADLRKTEQILTSHGIQKRFHAITKKRKESEILQKYRLFEVSDELSPSYGGGNSEETPQRKGKRKERETLSHRDSQVVTADDPETSGTHILSISDEERRDLEERFGATNAAELLEAVHLDHINGKKVRSWYAVAVTYGNHRVKQGQMKPPPKERKPCTNPECSNGWVLPPGLDAAIPCPQCSQEEK